MQAVNGLLSFDKVFKDQVLRKVPELKGIEFEVEFQKNIKCPGCGSIDEKGAGALFYRVNKNSEWIQAGESFKCSSCRDAEALLTYMNTDLTEQRQQISNRLTKEYYLLPDGLKNAGFKNYQETNKVTARAKRKAIDYTKSFIAGEKDRFNLLLTGSCGTGKSHLSVAISRTLKEKGFIVGFLTTGQLLSKIKSTYNKGSSKTEEDIFRDLKRIDCLILDDVGSEAIGGNEDWRKGMIFEIVESRSGKPTIYTSNLTEEDLDKAVGGRVYSRLFDNTQFIDLFTDDFRKNRQIK